MFYIIFNTYFKELSLHKMIYSYCNKKRLFISYIFSFTIFALFLYLIINYNIFNNYFIRLLSSFFSPVLIILIAFPALFVLNNEFKVVLKNIYSIDSKRLWNATEFNKMKRQRFISFLDGIKLLENEKKFNYLISLIDEKLSDFKTPYFINTGIIVAIVLPVWTQLIIWLFQHEVATGKDVAMILIIFVMSLSMILYFLFLIKTSIYDDVINAYYKKLKMLRTVLKELYFDNM